ncbi:hypothetical protein [Paraburkholderia sp. RL17-337-BIB-A]|uniref:hypothetical protein n=1 Tax=Paraburkholderia sp. RL17-337-BIB-A TaxID=3031636 RepID=UPI0038B6BDF7
MNQDATQYGAAVESFFGDDLHEMRLEMLRAIEPVVVDLGASGFTNFVEQLAAANMAKSFDNDVIATDTSRRGQEEAITTYQTLRGLGIPREAQPDCDFRHSVCCAGCRRRTTPVSVRFLGRRVYAAAIMVTVCGSVTLAMRSRKIAR